MDEIAPTDAANADDLAATLADAIEAIEDAGIDYLLVGGLAVVALGRLRHSRDIDLLVRPENARQALEALSRAGFETKEVNPNWLFKAFRSELQVDLIFKLRGDIYLDEEMLRRSTVETYKGSEVRIAPPEDLIVIKALTHDEETPRHWHDALSLIARGGLDWDYLLRRAIKGPRRVLSLLHYATSLDLLVPLGPLRSLSALVLDPEVGNGDEKRREPVSG
jgi:predicted nucleotidyltransferase